MSAAATPQSAADSEVPTVLMRAMQAHRAGQVDEAQRGYAQAMQIPEQRPDALHLLGLLHAQHRDYANAGELIAAAVEVRPDEAMFHNNLANVRFRQRRLEEAEFHYRRANTLAPDRLDVLNNLGIVIEARDGDSLEAEALFRRAIEIAPEFAEARHSLANHLLRQDRMLDAVRVCVEGIVVAPRSPALRRVLGVVYSSLGRRAEALAVYRAWLDADPDSAEAQFGIVACSGEGVPDRAPDRYVEQTFDVFADSFEANLAHLSYRAPQLVGEAVARHLAVPARGHDILDAGCGTGLCAPLLAPWSRRMVGVDLSAGMLEKARERGLYDELVHAELVACLAQRHAAFDLLVSADTLCYFGALEAFSAAARGAMRDDALLVFTVESHDDTPEAPDYRLNANGRYSHRLRYLQGCLGAADLETIEVQSVILRSEAGRPVQGWLVCARARRPV